VARTVHTSPRASTAGAGGPSLPRRAALRSAAGDATAATAAANREGAGDPGAGAGVGAAAAAAATRAEAAVTGCRECGGEAEVRAWRSRDATSAANTVPTRGDRSATSSCMYPPPPPPLDRSSREDRRRPVRGAGTGTVGAPSAASPSAASTSAAVMSRGSSDARRRCADGGAAVAAAGSVLSALPRRVVPAPARRLGEADDGVAERARGGCGRAATAADAGGVRAWRSLVRRSRGRPPTRRRVLVSLRPRRAGVARLPGAGGDASAGGGTGASSSSSAACAPSAATTACSMPCTRPRAPMAGCRMAALSVTAAGLHDGHVVLLAGCQGAGGGTSATPAGSGASTLLLRARTAATSGATSTRRTDGGSANNSVMCSMAVSVCATCTPSRLNASTTRASGPVKCCSGSSAPLPPPRDGVTVADELRARLAAAADRGGTGDAASRA